MTTTADMKPLDFERFLAIAFLPQRTLRSGDKELADGESNFQESRPPRIETTANRDHRETWFKNLSPFLQKVAIKIGSSIAEEGPMCPCCFGEA